MTRKIEPQLFSLPKSSAETSATDSDLPATPVFIIPGLDEQLSEDEQWVLMLIGIFYPYFIPTRDFVRWATNEALWYDHTKRTQKDLNAHLRSITQMQLIVKDARQSGIQTSLDAPFAALAAPYGILPIARDTLESQFRLAPWQTSSTAHYSPYYYDCRFEVHHLGILDLNRFIYGEIEELTSAVEAVKPSVKAAILALAPSECLNDFPDDEFESLFEHIVITQLKNGRSCEFLFEKYANLDAKLADATKWLCFRSFSLVLIGDFDGALEVYESHSSSARDPHVQEACRHATIALVEYFRGNLEKATEALQDAVTANDKIEKKKRPPLPITPAFMCALPVLLHKPNQFAFDLIENRLPKFLAADDVPLSIFAFSQPIEVAAMLAGLEIESETFSVDTHLQATLSADVPGVLAMAACFEDRKSQAVARAWVKQFDFFANAAAEEGYAWLAAQTFLLTHRLRHRNPRNKARGHPGHQLLTELGAVDILGLIKKPQAWSLDLARLEAFAETVKVSGQTSDTHREERLAWSFKGHDKSSYFEITPLLQLKKKKGGWTLGRKVSAKRLLEKPDQHPFLTDRDREALRLLAENKSGYRRDRRVEFELLNLIREHPNFVDEKGKPVSILKKDPEVHVKRVSGNAIRVKVVPKPDQYEPKYLLKRLSESSYELYMFTPAQLKIANKLTSLIDSFPISELDRVVEIFKRFGKVIPIVSDVEGISTEEVDPNTDVFVRLEPLSKGLRVAVVAEPISNSEEFVAPGFGVADVFTTIEGTYTHTKRNLNEERRQHKRLCDTCPTLNQTFNGETEFTISGIDACLELVEELNRENVRCIWPEGEQYTVTELTPSQLNVRVKSAAEWLSVSGEAKIDEDEVISMQHLLRILNQQPNSRYIELKEGQFIALSDRFRSQLKEFEALSTAAKDGERQVHPLTALTLDDLVTETQWETDDGYETTKSKVQQALAHEETIPTALKAQLREYQVEGFRWLVRTAMWSPGACLADDMGLGKTLQTLAFLLTRTNQGPALVIAPTSVTTNWLDEIVRFCPTLNARPYIGALNIRGEQLKNLGAGDVVITTYGIAHRDADMLAEQKWDTIVLDEAQAVKNRLTKRARSIMSFQADFKIATTGTPIQNNLNELYSLFGLLIPGLLGSQKGFKESFIKPIEIDKDESISERLRNLVAPFILRRLKDDVLKDLPPKTEIMHRIDMSAAEATLYEALRREAIEDLNAEPSNAQDNRFKILAHLTKLRLACCNPTLVQPIGAPESSKASAFMELLDELLEGQHKVLVFSQFVKHLKLIEDQLKQAEIHYQYLDGATSSTQRAERIANFQKGEGDVFLISLKAGGFGLNLTAADYVIHLDPWWNPAVEDQASDRAHRIGQTKPVTIYRLIMKGGIEEQIVDLHEHKRDLADRLLASTDVASSMSADELLALLKGSAEQ